MPKGIPIRDDVLAVMLGKFQAAMTAGATKAATYEVLGAEFGHEPEVVAHAIRRLQPTVNLATTKLQAAASRLADRIIRKANPSEAIDVLSRSNMGVLAPVKQAAEGPSQFLISVTADSCGAVKVGVAMGALPEAPVQAALPPVPETEGLPSLAASDVHTQAEGVVTDGVYEDPLVYSPKGPRSFARSLERANAQRKAGRTRSTLHTQALRRKRRVHAEREGDGGVQVADEKPEGA